MWMQRIAVMWVAWELTASPFWVGLVAFSDLFPAVLASPVAGALADRVDRMRLASLTQLVAAAHAVVMTALVVTGLISIWLLLALTIVLGINNSAAQPARQSLIPSLVPHADLPAAIALNALTYNVSRFIGPALAGVLLAYMGVAVTIAVNGVFYLVACWATQALRPAPVPARQQQSTASGLMQETLEGVRYAARHVGIGPLFAYAAMLGLLARVIPEVLPPFVEQVFERGVDGLAILTSVMGVCSILSGTAIAARGRLQGLTQMSIMAGIAMAAACAGFVATTSFAVGIVCAGLLSGTITIHGIAIQTLAQASCDAHMHGRVVSLWGMITRAAPALGALGFGTFSSMFGLRAPVLVLSGLCAMIWFWGMTRLPHLTAALEQKD